MHKALVMCVIIASIILGITVPNCSNGKNIESQNILITKQQAIELAVKSLVAKGWNPERYDMSVEETAEEWVVSFEGKAPCPPGGHAIVYISKKDGAARFWQGR